MSRLKFLLILATALFSCSSFMGCEKDNDGTASGDFASQIEGVYSGQLMLNNNVLQDAYIVTVRRIKSTVVEVYADFYSDGSENYNVEYINGQYHLKSETSGSVTITVVGKNINISFLNSNKSMTTYFGTRD
ncbi:MAG: type IV secretion protein Rhs [Alistipes sp.]|nr:type IV secretion protein Rhs [Alistipes sp.]